jgi:hypothetical protein
MPEPRVRRAKPDPNPLRLLLGLAGVASASALVTAMLPSIMPAQVVDAAQQQNDAAVAPQPSVIHVQKVVQLAPGQTAPPHASVKVQPQPAPKVRVKVVTRQSGKP